MAPHAALRCVWLLIVAVFLSGCISDVPTPNQDGQADGAAGSSGPAGDETEKNQRPRELDQPVRIEPRPGATIVFSDCTAIGWEVGLPQQAFPYIPPTRWSTSPFIVAPLMQGNAHHCDEVVIGNQTVARDVGFCIQYHNNLTAPGEAWETASYGMLALPLEAVTDSRTVQQALSAWGISAEHGDVSLTVAPTGIESSRAVCDGQSLGFTIAGDHATTTEESGYGFPYTVRLVTDTSEQAAWISAKADRRSTQFAPGMGAIGIGAATYWGDSSWEAWPIQESGTVHGVQIFSHVEAQWTWTYKGTGME